MENLTLIGTVTLIHLLAVMSPGPDFIMTVKNSLTYSRSTGIWTSIGLGLGVMVHLLYTLAGLAVVISKSILLFNIIKYLGAAYLMYIGVKSITSGKSHIHVGKEIHKKDISKYQAIKMGFLTNVLNPKVTLFMLSLFTTLITPQTPILVVLIISLIFVVNSILWFALVSVFLTQKRIRSVFERFQNVSNKVFGGLLFLIGFRIAISK